MHEALAKAGKLGIDDALRFLACFQGEKDYIVWDGLSVVLVGLQKLLMGGAPEPVYKGFMAFAERFVSISWEAAGVGWTASAQDAPPTRISNVVTQARREALRRFRPPGAVPGPRDRRERSWTNIP